MSRTLADASDDDSSARAVLAEALSAALPSCVDAASISSEIRPSSASVASTSEDKRAISFELLTQVCIVEHCPIELYVFTHRGLKNPDRPSERTDFIATIGERNSDRGIPGGNCFGNACDVRDRPGYACSAIALALAGIAIIARRRGIGHIGRHI
ncbi:MAG: hypothetical protein WBW67_05555, partial [Pseudolabrys sp.]